MYLRLPQYHAELNTIASKAERQVGCRSGRIEYQVDTTNRPWDSIRDLSVGVDSLCRSNSEPQNSGTIWSLDAIVCVSWNQFLFTIFNFLFSVNVVFLKTSQTANTETYQNSLDLKEILQINVQFDLKA